MKNKLGLSIICFEGTEHLKSIISEIRDLIDVIIIHKQNISYCGNSIDEEDLNNINNLKEIGLVDHIIDFDIINDMPYREQETIKRNNSIEFLQQQGCTHVMIIDSDEFYDHNEFAKAKEFIYNDNQEISYCRYINYYHDLTHYLIMPFECYVPFIFKSNYRFKFNCIDFELPSDPTRRVKKPINVNNFIFKWKDIKMHHFSWIRKDIRKKINNWSAKKYFDESLIDKAVESFKNWNGDPTTTILFHTPGNKVSVGELPKQYIFPKFYLEN